MKKILKAMSIVSLVFISISIFFYARYLNLDTYTWDIDNGILTLGEKQYKNESVGSSVDLKLEKQIGKIQGEDSSFRVWSIKRESIDDRIAIKGFMFPADTYSRIK
jgi:hypothetical protein